MRHFRLCCLRDFAKKQESDGGCEGSDAEMIGNGRRGGGAGERDLEEDEDEGREERSSESGGGFGGWRSHLLGGLTQRVKSWYWGARPLVSFPIQRTQQTTFFFFSFSDTHSFIISLSSFCSSFLLLFFFNLDSHSPPLSRRYFALTRRRVGRQGRPSKGRKVEWERKIRQISKLRLEDSFLPIHIYIYVLRVYIFLYVRDKIYRLCLINCYSFIPIPLLFPTFLLGSYL